MISCRFYTYHRAWVYSCQTERRPEKQTGLLKCCCWLVRTRTENQFHRRRICALGNSCRCRVGVTGTSVFLFWAVITVNAEKITFKHKILMAAVAFRSKSMWLSGCNLAHAETRKHVRDESTGHYASNQLDPRLRTMQLWSNLLLFQPRHKHMLEDVQPVYTAEQMSEILIT